MTFARSIAGSGKPDLETMMHGVLEIGMQRYSGWTFDGPVMTKLSIIRLGNYAPAPNRRGIK